MYILLPLEWNCGSIFDPLVRWPRGPGVDFRFCGEILLWRKIILGIYGLGVPVFQCPLCKVCPAMSSEEAPALSWPQVKRRPPTVYLFITVVTSNFLHYNPAVHGAMDCNQKSFKLVCWCHQLLSGFLANGHLPRVSRQSRRSLGKWKLSHKMDNNESYT